MGYYRQSSPGTCFATDEPVELFVPRYEDATWLTRAGIGLEQSGDLGKATVLFNEAFQLDRSPTTFEQTLRSAAKALGLDPDKAIVFDPVQNKRVASKELVDAIKAFQRAQGISADGVLGPQTLQKLGGGRTTPELILHYSVQPPNKPEVTG